MKRSACLLGVLWILAATPWLKAEMTVFSTNGSVKISADGQVADAKPGAILPPGALVETGPSGSAILTTSGGWNVQVGPGSETTVEKAEAGGDKEPARKEKVRLNLRAGSVIAALPKTLADGQDFQVVTPIGVAAARGTVFKVSFSGGKMMVTVAEGLVRVDWKEKNGRKKNATLSNNSHVVCPGDDEDAEVAPASLSPQALKDLQDIRNFLILLIEGANRLGLGADALAFLNALIGELEKYLLAAGVAFGDTLPDPSAGGGGGTGESGGPGGQSPSIPGGEAGEGETPDVPEVSP